MGKRYAGPRGPQKFYAVRKGHRPGMYTKEREARAQLEGFSGHEWKMFRNRSDAEKFLAATGSSQKEPNSHEESGHAGEASADLEQVDRWVVEKCGGAPSLNFGAIKTLSAVPAEVLVQLLLKAHARQVPPTTIGAASGLAAALCFNSNVVKAMGDVWPIALRYLAPLEHVLCNSCYLGNSCAHPIKFCVAEVLRAKLYRQLTHIENLNEAALRCLLSGCPPPATHAVLTSETIIMLSEVRHILLQLLVRPHYVTRLTLTVAVFPQLLPGYHSVGPWHHLDGLKWRLIIKNNRCECGEEDCDRKEWDDFLFSGVEIESDTAGTFMASGPGLPFETTARLQQALQAMQDQGTSSMEERDLNNKRVDVMDGLVVNISARVAADGLRFAASVELFPHTIQEEIAAAVGSRKRSRESFRHASH